MAKTDIGTVYLIHFDKPYKHCRHYIGWTNLPEGERFNRHKNGNGSKLLRAVNKAGIEYKIVRTWENVSFEFEQKLKKRKNASQLCPVCIAEKKKKEENEQCQCMDRDE
jgi:predicted GIY-YIG superfamily endonuclease